MKPKRYLFWLGGTAILLFLGSYFLAAWWGNNKRLYNALPSEEQQVLDRGQSFILYSLHPRPREIDPQELKTKPDFHGYMVLGQTQITTSKTRTDLLRSLYDVLGKGDPALCFNPRHGIRAVQNNKTVDLVICFECQQIEIYDEGRKRVIRITSSPQYVFDQILIQANIPLAGR